MCIYEDIFHSGSHKISPCLPPMKCMATVSIRGFPLYRKTSIVTTHPCSFVHKSRNAEWQKRRWIDREIMAAKRLLLLTGTSQKTHCYTGSTMLISRAACLIPLPQRMGHSSHNMGRKIVLNYAQPMPQSYPEKIQQCTR